mgnify:CR=1 FL=1
MDIYAIVDGILRQLGFDGVGIIALYSILVLACRVIARIIPDDKAGILGMVRKITRGIGLDVSNRISSGVSINDVSKASLTIANVARVAQKDDVPIPLMRNKNQNK